ncbi:hypothetical protein JCM3774_006553 [Rhodotorula dairenensis]
MFAPAAPLARAVAKAKRQYRATKRHVRQEVDVAQQLYQDATQSPEDAHREGEPVPEEMDPDEAGDLVEDEYRPLMSDEQRGGKAGRRGAHDDDDGGSGSDEDDQGGHAWTYRDGDGAATKARKLEVWLAQGIFFVLGAAILLSWNTEIVAGSYFGERLKGSPFERSFANFVALTFTTANLLFLAWANATQAKADLNRRILWSLFVLIAILCIFVGSTQFAEINTTLFFSFLIVSAILLGASASYLQNAVVALSASFGPVYLNQILSGQGAIGFVVAMIQFVAAYGAVKAAQRDDESRHFDGFRLQLRGIDNDTVYAGVANEAAKEVRQTAFAFFLTVLGVALASLVSYIGLVRLPLYRLVFRAEFDPSAHADLEDTDKKGGNGCESVVRRTERKVRHLGIAIFLVFCVTLAVFPSITATITSVRTGSPDANLLQQPALFVPLGFAVFAGGDWLGRVLPQWEFFQWTNWKGLMACSVARIVFVPLFLICNQSAGGTGLTIIRSDVAFFAIMLAFSVSNGYISTLIMLASVVEPTLEEDEIEVAATCLAFYLTLGLSVGSLLSFAVRGAICRCNPFL